VADLEGDFGGSFGPMPGEDPAVFSKTGGARFWFAIGWGTGDGYGGRGGGGEDGVEADEDKSDGKEGKLWHGRKSLG